MTKKSPEPSTEKAAAAAAEATSKVTSSASPKGEMRDVVDAFFRGDCAAIAASFYQNERPLRGLAGWLDWRFQGAISECLKHGILSGKPGECAYVPVKRAGRDYHVILAGGGTLPADGTRADLPAASWEALRKNLSGLKLSKIGVSQSDLGAPSTAELEKKLKGVSLWIAP